MRVSEEGRVTMELEELEAKVESLFDAIKHGDKEHKAWLKEAIKCHFMGKPIPKQR